MKITKYILSFAAAAGLLAACQTPEIVQIASPENVVPASLHELEIDEIAISATNQKETVVFTWDAADYGASTQISYSLEAALDETSQKVTIVSGVSATEVTITYEDLNRVLFNDLQVPEGQPTELKLYVGSVLYAGSSVASYPKVYSEPAVLTVTVTAAEKVYPKLTVAGSYAYNNWSPGKGQFVYDFEGTDTKYSGVIDFGEDVSALQFKFVGESWGNNEFSVPAGEAQTPEAAELPLVSGGGDNISAYTTHRYYSLTLDKGTPKVVKNFSFNSLGVVGDGTPTGWDADTDMQFNADKQRFYVDLTLVDGTIKFRVDDAWTLDWGGADGKLEKGGANIAVTAGNYRIYVNLNDPANPTYELNAGMYGKEEPTSGSTTPETPEPTPLVGWGLVGEYNSWGAEADVMLASDGTFLVAKGVALSGQVKFRKDGDWAVNFGAPGDVEPVAVAVNTELELVANGKNFTIAEGTYDVYLDEVNAKAWFITDGSYPGGGTAPEASEWGVVGVVNNWGNTAGVSDVVMYKTSTEGLFVAYNVSMPDGGFKIRANNEWNDAANYGLATAGAVEVDHYYDVISSGGSGDMTLVAGNYDIWFDRTNEKVYIMTPGKPISEAVGGEANQPGQPDAETWYLVGEFNNWTVADASYKMTYSAGWHVFTNFTLPTDGKVKLNAGSWDVNRGGEFAAVGSAIAVTNNGADIVVPAGTYDVYLNKAEDTLYFMESGKTPAN